MQLKQNLKGRVLAMRTVTTSVCIALAIPACQTTQGSEPGRAQGGTQGQQSTYDPCKDKLAQDIGMLIGVFAGIKLGRNVSHGKYAGQVGALAGAFIGAAIGRDVARRQCDVYKVALKHDLEYLSSQLVLPSKPGSTDNAVVGLSGAFVEKSNSTGHFQPNSDQLTPEAMAYFSEVAQLYSPVARAASGDQNDRAAITQSRILIVGHTDDQEDSVKSADLAEKRARAVATVFRNNGIADNQIYYQGAGETLPIADNNTEQGRAKNRRVEVVDVANAEVMDHYLTYRVSTKSYFRPVVPDRTADFPQVARVEPVKSAAKVRDNPRTERVARVPAAADKSLQSTHTADRASKPVQVAQNGRAPSGVVPAGAGIDIGGSAFDPTRDRINIGEPIQSIGFSFIPVAVASDRPVTSCVEDRPRIARSVKSLRDGTEFRISEFRPGAYGTSWTGMVNGNLVALNNVAVVRAGGLPAADPTVLIYKNFDVKNGAQRKADYASTPTVNTYAGTQGLLYRVFFDKNAPLKCIDVVLPASPPFQARQGFLYQDRAQKIFSTEFRPAAIGSRT